MPNPYSRSLYDAMQGQSMSRKPPIGIMPSAANIDQILPQYANKAIKVPYGSSEYRRQMQMEIDPSVKSGVPQKPAASVGAYPGQSGYPNTNLRDLLFRYGVDDQGPGVQNMLFIYGVDDQNPNPIVPLYNRMNPSQTQNSYYDYGPRNGTPWYMR